MHRNKKDVMQQEVENNINDILHQCELDAQDNHINSLPNEILFRIISYCTFITKI